MHLAQLWQSATLQKDSHQNKGAAPIAETP